MGAYSALNGVAGAYAERLPVIFVSSGPNTNDPVANHIMHHTMGTHDFSDQYEVCRQVTCEAVRILHADNAPTLIDQAISTALRERKPVYIEIAPSRRRSTRCWLPRCCLSSPPTRGH